MASRFADLNEEDVEELIKNKDSDSTRKAIDKAVKLFREYLVTKTPLKQNSHQQDLDLLLAETSDDDIDSYLKLFYANVCTKDGKSFKKSSFSLIKYGLSRYFKSKGTDIAAGRTFEGSRLAYKGILADLAKKGLASVDHKPPISPEDLLKLHEVDHHTFDTATPCGLQNKFWFDVMYYICRRGRENLRTMTKNTFAIGTDGSGRDYFYQKVSESDKNHKENVAPEMF